MKKTAKVILGSAMTMAMCASLIAGSTLALFSTKSETDIAITSAKVDVKATIGDVQPYHTDATTNAVVDGSFGHTGTAYSIEENKLSLTDFAPYDGVKIPVTVVNDSTISIKYQVRITSASEGGEKDLFDALTFTLEGSDLATTTLGKTTATDWQLVPEAKGEIGGFTINVYFPEAENNNDYQGVEGHLNIAVMATQSNANTTNPSEVAPANPDPAVPDTTSYAFDATQLQTFAEEVNSGSWEGKTILLMDDIDLEGEEWTPIGVDGHGFVGTFDGKGHTVSNLTVHSDGDNAGLFGAASGSKFSNINFTNVDISGKNYAAPLGGNIYTSSVSNVTVKGGKVSANHWAGGVAASAYGNFTNCHVEGLTITATPAFNGSKYDDGDKAGGIVGQCQDSGAYTFDGCSVTDTTITAYRDLGGLVGCGMSPDKNYKNNTVKNVTLIVDRTLKNQYVEEKEYNVGEIVGRGEMATDENNTVENVQIKFKNVDLADNGNRTFVTTKAGLTQFAAKVSDGETYNGKTVVLTDNIDLGGTEWTPIGTSDKPFEGVFDGNGHTISNLKIDKPDQEQLGLFSYIHTAGAEIKNFTIHNVEITGKKSVGAVMGGRTNSGGLGETISNVTVNGLIKITGNQYVGGIAGSTPTRIQHCDVIGDDGSVLEGVYQASDLEGDNVGGITGFTAECNHRYEDVVNYCNVSNITVRGTRKVGGIVAYLHSGEGVQNSTFKNGVVECNADESYIGTNYAKIGIGGIVGQAHESGVQTILNNVVENITISAPNSFTFVTATSDQTLTSAILGNARTCNTVAGLDHAKTIVASGNTAKNVTVNAKLNDVTYAVYSSQVYVGSVNVYSVADMLNVIELQAQEATSHVFGRNNAGENRTVINFAEGTYDLSDVDWKPFNGFRYDFIANGNVTIKNMNMQTAQWRGGFVDTMGNAIIDGFTFENATIVGEQAGVVAGHSSGGTIRNVTIKGEVSVSYEGTVKNETVPGIGFVVGVLAEGNTNVENVNFVEGTTLTVDYGAGFSTSAPFNNYMVGFIAGGTYEGEVHEGDGVEIVVKNMPKDVTFGNSSALRPTDGMYLDPGVNLTIDGETDETEDRQTVINVEHTAFNYFNSVEGITEGRIVIRNVHFKGTEQQGYVLTVGFEANVEVVLENCTFENMHCAVYCNRTTDGNVNLTIRNCKYMDTDWGYGIAPGSVDSCFNVTFDSNTGIDTSKVREVFD